MKLLQTLERVLDAAEGRQFEDVAVKMWVDDLRDVAYDLEVILDEFDTNELQKQLGIGTEAVLSKLKFKWEFRSQVKDIASRLQDIRDRMEVLDLIPVSGMSGGSSAAAERLRDKRESVSGLTDSGLFVRDAQKQKLIELVKSAASANCGDSKRRVFAVVGTGGMGKTTLAQRVYHDLKQSQCFNMNAWVCISDQFQLMTIMEKILREIGGDSSDNKSLQEVHKKIEGKIDGKTLLLFLDDAWERDHTEWETMWSFLNAAKQIIVVLTTRDQQVASSSGALPNDHFLLHKLSDEDCLSVFQHYAFQNKDMDAYPMLKDIGVQIVNKCDGSPLVAKVLGGILRCKSTEHEWKSVLHSQLLAVKENSIRSILILSYHHLRMPLKRCFAFTAIFPKDYEFEEQEIVLLWMAQGFLQHSNQTESEDVGHNYFHDLLSRSFFQPSPSKTGSYVMHDLIHDLAQEVAGKTCFRLEEMMGADQIQKLSSTTRYASYNLCKHEDYEKSKIFGQAHSLQTLVRIVDHNTPFQFPTVDDKLYKLYHLRVLSLRNSLAIYELHHSVTKLKHLRYLDFSYTDIEVLQDSICTLVNLKTLLLKGCRYLVKLPDDFSNLINIRHLDISGSTRLTDMPRLTNLKSLHTLSDFIVSKDIRRGIQQLKGLNQIKSSLCLSKLENVPTLEDASQAMLKEKTKLQTLAMRWTNSNDNSYFQNIYENVLEELKPPQQLEKLTIEGFMGTKLPRWMGDSSFPNITSLSINSCKKCTCLPPLGKLPALRYLYITAFQAIVKVDSHFCGELFLKPFSSLEILEFEDMSEWEDWYISDEVKVFPRLKKLSILHCPKLSGKLPEQLLELEELVIKYCDSLVVFVPKTLKLQSLEIDGCKEATCNNFNDWSLLNSLFLKNIGCLSISEEMRCRLKTLVLENCSLEKLPQVLRANDSSFYMKLSRCPNFISFPDEIEFSSDNSDYSDSTLSIFVYKCAALEYIPVFKMQEDCCSTLVDIKIEYCDSLTGFAKGLLPRTLRILHLRNCKKLRCLVVVEEEEEKENKSNSDLLRCSSIQLDELEIVDCDSLEYLAFTTRGKLPFRFKRLYIESCKNLKSLIMRPLASLLLEELPEELESLDISGCPELKELAESFHINNSSNALQSINIYECESLKCLPNGLHNMKSLKKISVTRCEKLEAPPPLPPYMGCGIVNVVVDNNPALETLDIEKWPAGNTSLLNEGFQRINTTLITLAITYPNTSGRSANNKPISEWGLSRLVSLQQLYLHGEEYSDVDYFPESINSFALPSSLTRLIISDFRNLKYLSCHLFKNLGSLEDLVIWDCPKLESFPKGGLPLSLLRLIISGCPKLEERYQNKKKMKAKDWSKISHISYITINSKAGLADIGIESMVANNRETIQKIWLENNES